MAFRAAMTGHQVFSTLHTNSAIRSIPRLVDLGIKPEVLAGNVIGIVAQRLLRTLCKCKVPHDPSEIELHCSALNRASRTSLHRRWAARPVSTLGYKGRTSILELLKFDAALDELVTQRASLKFCSICAPAGFVTMAEDGLRRVREGITTIEEVGRVVDLTELIALMPLYQYRAASQDGACQGPG
jgi:type IV pilus assembly protein PilB